MCGKAGCTLICGEWPHRASGQLGTAWAASSGLGSWISALGIQAAVNLVQCRGIGRLSLSKDRKNEDGWILWTGMGRGICREKEGSGTLKGPVREIGLRSPGSHHGTVGSDDHLLWGMGSCVHISAVSESICCLSYPGALVGTECL